MSRWAKGEPGLAHAVGLLLRSAPGTTVCLAAVVLAGAVAPTVLIVLTGLLVQSVPDAVGAGLGSAAGRHLLVMLGWFGLAAFAEVVLGGLETGLTRMLELRVAAAVDTRVMAASLGPPGVAHLEDPEYADRLRLATDEESRPVVLATWLPGVVRPRLQAVGLVAVLAPFAWWAPVVLVAAAVVTYWQYYRWAHTIHGSLVDSTGVIRRAGYFRGLAVDPEPAKEVRLFGLGGWVVERMVRTWRDGMAAVWASRRASRRHAYLTLVGLVLAEALVLGSLAVSAAHGDVGLAAVIIYAQAAIALPLLGWVGDPDYRVRQALVGLRALVRLERAAPERPAGGDVPAADLPRREVRLRDVQFSYATGHHDVLAGLDLQVPAGTSVAIVGANGTGKTTLIKLLARLYDPTGGAVLVDGVNLRDLDLRQWRRRVSVVFQDVVRYPLSLRENVAMGDPGCDQQALDRALSLAGGSALLASLPNGWDTLLTRQVEGGVDLSGGQWQVVALARALLAARHGGVLILDEPTANLDVRAEAELFDRFLDLTRGTTTILVSHRFSTVRRADLICVLDGGRVVESGTHDDLLARNGRYAHMFRLQAARFEDGSAPAPAPVTPAEVAPAPSADRAPAVAEPDRRSVRGALAGLGTLIRAAFAESGRLALVGLLLVPVTAVLGALSALWMQVLVNGAARSALTATLLGAALLTVTVGLGQALDLAGATARITLSERVGFSFDRALADLTVSVPGLHHHEAPAFLDRLHLLRARMLGMGGLLNWALNFLHDFGGFAVTAALLATVHPALLLLPLVGLAAMRLQVARHVRTNRTQDRAAPDYRIADQFLRLATASEAGKELRVCGVAERLSELQRATRARADTLVRRSEVHATAVDAVAGLLITASMVGAVAAVAVLATRGQVGLGGVLLVFMLANRFVAHVSGVVRATGVVADLLRHAERLRWLRAYAERVRPAPATADVPATLHTGLILEHVSFSYPDSAAPVLCDVSLRLAPGTVVALVGENGAGKTTLIKLLCRYYEPTAGRIRVDGADLRTLSPARWRESLSAAFQDFARFELLAREAVGVGDLPRLDDRPAVVRALERAGAADLPAALPHGLDTQLGGRWDGGQDLSAGQWQKVALGRALMRTSPLLLVLDEPTASLDAETEHALFERFSAAARAGGGTGTITVLVSHRFSTVRMADLIVVLSGGRIVEVGSHHELLGSGGTYADLYGLQARAYR